MAQDFIIHFWGGRGTFPTPGAKNHYYGGHTSCVEVRCGQTSLVLDAGTGIKALGDSMASQTIDILLSHTHLDHIMGFPVFIPAYDKNRKIRVWAGHLKPDYRLRDVISQLMSPPLFPLTIDQLSSSIDYIDFSAGEELRNDDWGKQGIRVKTLPLFHPDRATGYRIEYAGKSMCYITDYEHTPGLIEPALAAFVQGADCLIYDSTYCDENFERYRGWGHSTWQQAVRLADHAKVKTLVIFHHDPDANDAILEERAKALEAMRPGSVMVRDGLEIHFDTSSIPLIVPPPSTAINEDAVKLVERLTTVGMALSGARDIDRLLEIILVEAKEIAGADGGTLYYLTEDNKLEFAIIRNDVLGIANGGTTGNKANIPPLNIYDPVTHEPNYNTLAVYAVLTRSPINIPDVYSADGFDFEAAKTFDKKNNYQTHSVIAIPMVSNTGEVMGCLQLVNAKDASGKVIPFSHEVQQLVHSLASQAAVTFENKKLIDAQKKLLESFIQMIAQAIDAKSHYTGAHCERVPVLTNMLAKAACDAKDGIYKDFNLTDGEKYELHIAGWIHDCGKVATPVHVMDKSTKLEAIYDRIELVKTRFEVFKRDAKIAMLEQLQMPGSNRTALENALSEKLKKLDDDFAFIEKTNIGSEFMPDATMDRLKEIAALNLLNANELYNLSVRKGTLTDEDRKIMNDHMVHTCTMLETLPFPKHLKRVPEYAGGHHERMDGKGYPKGIKAGTMSLPARMMAVADVFEALTSADRPYKPAKKLSEAMQIIGQMKKQNHLDPDLVDFFVTSKVYLDYAHKFLPDAQIDAVDEAALLAIKPLPL